MKRMMSKGGLTVFVVMTLLFAFALEGVAREFGPPTLTGSKLTDTSRWHDVGNFWLRVSNQGQIGADDETDPRYPAGEFPAGSGIDYVYIGALWLSGKMDRNQDGQYTASFGEQAVANHQDLDNEYMLITSSDGWKRIDSMHPAYNISEADNPRCPNYDYNNARDRVAESSTRTHKRGIDDDGDWSAYVDDADNDGYVDIDWDKNGMPSVDWDGPDLDYNLDGDASYDPEPYVDEDWVGNRVGFRMYTDIADFTNEILSNDPANPQYANTAFQRMNILEWYELYAAESNYVFTSAHDEDGDGQTDEDSAPISEQDFYGVFYDYSPFGDPGERELGSSASENYWVPMFLMVEQRSYAWSYNYINNLIFVEYSITNMNGSAPFPPGMPPEYYVTPGSAYPNDWLSSQSTMEDLNYTPERNIEDFYLAVYLDADCGPQTWDDTEVSGDDGSGYDQDDNYAFTYDVDFDGGLTSGMVGMEVVAVSDVNNPAEMVSPEEAGVDYNCYTWQGAQSPEQQHQYELMRGFQGGSGLNYDAARFPDLTTKPNGHPDAPGSGGSGEDTRFLFSCGPVPVLRPGETVKILTAVFAADASIEGPAALKKAARWARAIYGDAAPHYTAPSAPDAPDMLALYDAPGSPEQGVELWWMSNAEKSLDEKYLPNDFIDFDDDYSNGDLFPLSLGSKLRNDFQGYRIWKSYTGEADAYTLLGQWDIKDDNGEIDNGFGYYFDGTQWVDGGSSYPIVTLPGGALDLSGSLGYNTGLPTIDGTYCWGDNPRKAYQFSYTNVPQYVKDKYLEQYGQAMPRYIDDADTTAGEWVWYKFVDDEVREGREVYYSVTAFDRGMPSFNVPVLESGKDANRQVFFPGTQASSNSDDVYVVPNPYLGKSAFDGQTDVAKRIWFVNLPETCTIRIYTLSGDLVQTIEHDGPHMASITSARQAVSEAITSSGVHEWNMVTRNNQSVASGVYLYSVEDEDGNIHVDKFVLVK